MLESFEHQESNHRAGNTKNAYPIFLLLLFLAIASGCRHSAELPGAPSGLDGSPDPGRGPFPCGLLTQDEVELSLNSQIPKPPSPSSERPILVGMKMCSAVVGTPKEQSSFSAASWGVLTNSANRKVQKYRALHRSSLSELDVGDEQALWDEKLRTLVVPYESKAFGIRLTVANPPEEKNQSTKNYLKRAAEELATIALRRL